MKTIIFLALLALIGLLVACRGMLAWVLPRPQEPRERPYRIEKVSFAGASGDVTLAGELTMPSEDGPFPAVILIAGSGPYDRDENISGHKILLVLSDYLTRRGYAVLRYDKRGIGKSTGDYQRATIADFAADAAAALRWLKSDPRVDATRIGYAGHSSGKYVAPLAAQKEAAAFLVLLAAPAENLGDTLVRQNEEIAVAQQKSEAWIERNQTWIQALVDIFQSATDPDAARAQALALYADYHKALGQPKNGLRDYFKLLPPAWMLWAFQYDPTTALRAYQGPVLALFGGLDLQVSARHNVPRMEKMLGHPQSRVKVLSGLNHLFQPAETGTLEEYGAIDITIDESAMGVIADWIENLE